MSHRTSHRTSNPRRRQRGAALLTAMIIVTLVATLAAAMVWQQWRAVQVEQAERGRTQAAWILSGGLEFARLILSEDGKSRRPTALTELWARPLAEARLSTFLALDKNNTDDGPEAFLSGDISDAQARYNLRSLLAADPTTKQLIVNPDEKAKLERLCGTLGVDSGVAQRIATGLRDASGGGGGGGDGGTGTHGAAPLMPKSTAQLSWFGIDATSLQALQPFIVLLPTATPVNVNTASVEVLVAVIDGLDRASAERLVQMRQRAPFKDTSEFNQQLAKPLDAPKLAALSTLSTHFEVRSRLRLVDRVLVERSMLLRSSTPPYLTTVLSRERIPGFDQPGS